MALKFVQTGYTGSGGASGGTYDHNLLINRGLPDQHTIESITGLRTALNKKYEKPFSGIPKTDLAFDVATMHDLDVLRTTEIVDLSSQILALATEVQQARGNESNLKAYIDTKVSYADWSGGGGGSGGGHVESQVGYPIYEEHRPQQGQKIFKLQKTFRFGTHQLEVYTNGLKMVENDDYIELDSSTVEFITPLEVDDLVVFQVRAVINSGLHEEYVAIHGQTTFKLANPYGINQNILQVFRNGVLCRKGRDYKEIDDTTVEFAYPLNDRDYITFKQAGATDPIAGTVMESEIGRVKINLGYTTMRLHDSVQTADTDYRDMYIDTFITPNNIDELASFPYLYKDFGVEVRPITTTMTSSEDFEKGIATEVDTRTHPGSIRLKNQAGGSEAHDFAAYTIETSGNKVILDSLLILTRNRVDVYFYITDVGTKRELKVRLTQGDVSTEHLLGSTTGHYFGLSAEQDAQGSVHLVYHEQGVGTGKVRYVIVRDDGSPAIPLGVISDPAYDAMNADIDIDSSGEAHIVFMSKRINPSYFNIDYLKISVGVKSSVKDVTSFTAFDAVNPRIALSDDKVHIIYESVEIDKRTKNLFYKSIEADLIVGESAITTSTSFDNVMPDLDVDSIGSIKIVWRSKRLGSTYGIDFCTISPTGVISSVKTLATGSFQAGRPRISIDYEDISHIAFHANVARVDTDNIMYSYVYPDGSISPLVDIASAAANEFTDPNIYAYGDRLVVSYLGTIEGFKVEKSLANYTGMGRYDLVIDTKTPDASWNCISIDSIVPNGSNVKTEYRVSNDEVAWSPWKSSSSIAADKKVGRYMQVRITLSSTDSNLTPEVNEIAVEYLPTFIEVQCTSRKSAKDVDSLIVIAKASAGVTFKVSRDGGLNWADAQVETAVNMLTKPNGKEVVVKAKIETGSRLDAWGLLW
ncbi:hypothetical protein ACK8P5_25720 (plasmid) [Paenibacillus sp. EC2-1]|uniref:hypothetical protein n=1 Tax=Paenibacillus sp. EC2-1 TaxID=3388665 RepID=UPI003BEF48DC